MNGKKFALSGLHVSFWKQFWNSQNAYVKLLQLLEDIKTSAGMQSATYQYAPDCFVNLLAPEFYI
jgi:hypothetical protein